MSSQLLARNTLRMRSRLPIAIRQNSTQQKAQESLQTAQKSAEKALEGAKKMSGDVGNRLAGLLGGSFHSLAFCVILVFD